MRSGRIGEMAMKKIIMKIPFNPPIKKKEYKVHAWYLVCGSKSPRVTNIESRVTCKRCLRLIKES